MKQNLLKAAFFGILMFGVAIVQANGQTLINEVQVGNPTNDSVCDFIELRGAPGAPLTNLYLTAVAGDESNGRGALVLATSLGTQSFGSSGLLIVKGNGQCGDRVFPANATVVTDSRITDFGTLENTQTLSILLINSTAALPAVFTDIDVDNNGTLEGLPAGASVVDAVGYFANVSAVEDIVYGGVAVNFDPANQEIIRNGPDAVTRFAGNNTPLSAAAFYYGDISNSSGADSTAYLDNDQRSPNFPAGGALTPGAANVPSGPVVTSQPRFDFNADGRSDQAVYRAGDWFVNLSPGNTFLTAQFGNTTDIIAPDDYDGDGKTDFAVWRPETTSSFYILQSATNTIRIEAFGLIGDKPVGGDWDGDGKDDLAVYRNGASSGAPSTFYYLPSSAPTTGFVSIEWGISGDLQVAADYDGDNRFDAAVYRGGIWYARLSSNGQLFSLPFGAASDIPVPADYNGDGRDDQAVFRDGTWYANLSPANNFVAIAFGAAGDIPVAADYNGDGRDDQAVFRGGVWYANLSPDNGFLAIQFGLPSDQPIPAAYLP